MVRKLRILGTAIGVGPGNGNNFIEKTADILKMQFVKSLDSKTFDMV